MNTLSQILIAIVAVATFSVEASSFKLPVPMVWQVNSDTLSRRQYIKDTAYLREHTRADILHLAPVEGVMPEDMDQFLARATKLRGEIVPRYWNADKGALMHMIYNDGRTDPMLTRYPNMFGLFFGYFDEAQKASVVKNVMLNDGVMRIQTPYMRFYELEALCSLGMQKEVLKEMKSYWGGMLRLGATSFWELYNPDEKGDAHYAMYGRRFGKSLCHAWGASPVYLLGRYFLGVVPTSPGFATYDVKPNLGGLDWIDGDVPTPHGCIRVRVDADGVSVESDGGDGILVMPDGRRVPIPAGKTTQVRFVK